MKYAFTFLLVVHGLIHLMGFFKAFGLAELPALTRFISRPMGALWLLAAALFLASAASLHLFPRAFWAIGAAAVVVSQLVIVPSWVDARAGTIANALALVGVAYSFLSRGPTSLHAEYLRDLADGLARRPPAPLVTEADLAPLPAPLQKYLRLTGSVGQPRVRSFHVVFRGRMRGGPDAAWMDMDSHLQLFFDRPSRLFYMEASMKGVPAVGYHRYVGSDASMRVKIAAAVPVVDLHGPALTKAENVTLLAEACAFAPSALLDAAVVWEPVDDRAVRARFTNAGFTIQADLLFDEAGELVDIRSDDKPQVADDGTSFTAVRWSSPLREYRSFGPRRAPTKADLVYDAKAGKYAYGELEVLDVTFDGAPTGGAPDAAARRGRGASPAQERAEGERRR